MFYTRLSYEEFIDSISLDINEAAFAAQPSVKVNVPREYTDRIQFDLELAGYRYSVERSEDSDLDSITIGWYPDEA